MISIRSSLRSLSFIACFLLLAQPIMTWAEGEKSGDDEINTEEKIDQIPDELGQAGDPHFYIIYINRDEDDEQKFSGQWANDVSFQNDTSRSYSERAEKKDVYHLNVENDEIAIEAHIVSNKVGVVAASFQNDPKDLDHSYLEISFKNQENATFVSQSGSYNMLESTAIWGAEVDGGDIYITGYKVRFGGLYKNPETGKEQIISGELLINKPHSS
jgi:hypothetical protein